METVGEKDVVLKGFMLENWRERKKLGLGRVLFCEGSVFVFGYYYFRCILGKLFLVF